MFQRYSRTRRAGAALAAILLVGFGATEAVADRALTPLPFKDGFESGSTAAFPRKGIDGTGRVDVKAALGGRGGKAVRFAMPDDGKSYRTEIATARVPYGSYRYTFANYLPGNWIRFDAQTIVSQWHGGAGTYPAVVLAVKGDRWMMIVHWKSASEKAEQDKPAHEVKYDLGPVRFGHWNQWSFDITWSTAADTGSITARLNGAHVGSHRGPNSYHQDTAPYHKIGLYRPNWQAWKGHKAGGTAAVVNYYDDVTITAIRRGAVVPPPTTPSANSPAAPAPDGPGTSQSPSAQASASAPAAGPAAPGSAPDATEDIPMDTGSDEDTGNDVTPLAETGVSSRTPIILASGSVLLAAGLVLVFRRRAKVARLLAGGRKG